jgi:hypothetical protein
MTDIVDKPVGGDFSLRAFNVVRCLAQAEFRSEVDRCKDEAEYLMSTLRGEKLPDYLRVHFPELDEITALRDRVAALEEALRRVPNPEGDGHANYCSRFDAWEDYVSAILATPKEPQ